MLYSSSLGVVRAVHNELYCLVQHQLHGLMFTPSLSVESPGTPQSAVVALPLNSVFPVSPLNGCDACFTPSPTLSMSSGLLPTTSRHPYINTAAVDLTGGGQSMMEYGWYVCLERKQCMVTEHVSS